ncbi:nucleotide-binding universal stress UspA family protein [Arthrobacter silviterrae]|uniref:Universal stress protein n=2 Tax=Arthrobacter TaxID=1663 RepID=A0ABX0DFR4_9MICC|nr:universal stress protein [Arthrobacter silviterrae]MDQ0275970.1 nucleotide-binding universal stress UspA family protein [Arthrobacter silviterrae]NGN84220.1 universal stress protein [Arthrobacter silviterrae]
MNKRKDAPMVIVGVDGSAPSVEALRQAEKLAIRMGAQVQALACWSPPAPASSYGVGNVDYEKNAQNILDNAIQVAFGIDWPENLTTRLVRGPARETLIKESRNAMMLVLGRRGFGGFRGLLMGSVSSACTAYAHCPVLVVHAGNEANSKRDHHA